jgi:hypothetical protein
MKLPRLDLELPLLLIALATCVLGVMQLVHPVSIIPKSIDVVIIVLYGELCVIFCAEDGSHAVARPAVLSLCFGVQSVAIWIYQWNLFWVALSAAFSIFGVYSALTKHRKLKQKAGDPGLTDSK